METAWLFEAGSGKPFAFSTDGEKSWFTQNGRPWAWQADNGWMWSYETSQALGWFRDKWVFDPQGKPILYKNH